MNEDLIPLADVAALPASGVRRLTGMQRVIATAMLAIGLLGVGGVALVHAADPTPTATTSTTTTTGPSSGTNTNGGTTTHTGHDCPNSSGSSN